MNPFDLSELKALPIPRCRPEDQGARFLALARLPEYYLAAFVAPRLSESELALNCLGCGEDLYRAGIAGFLLGAATFTWGLANGEGYCSGCGYPTRMYHRLPEGTATFPLQYHPDDLVQPERRLL